MVSYYVIIEECAPDEGEGSAMNLYDFEEAVSSTIVERGSEYYDAGFVAKLVRIGDGRYTASVEGADLYEVAIQLDAEGNIISSYCDCPYDWGPVCKHEVAVYYELIDRLKDNDFPEITTDDHLNLETALDSLSKAELIDILVNLAEQDPILHNELLFTYTTINEDKEVERCKKMIDLINEKYGGIDRFITYEHVDDFTDELSVVLNKVGMIKDPLIAMEIAVSLLHEGMNSFQYADDSGGAIGRFVDETISMLNKIATGPLREVEQSELLDRLIHLSKSNLFDGWNNFRIDVLGIGMNFAGNIQLRNTLTNALESMIVETSENGYDRYSNERIFNLLYDIIETYGTIEEARQFLEDNIIYPSFRKRLMQEEMKEGNYENVLSLASEGECIDKDYRGLVMRWKKWSYEAYKQLKSRDAQMRIGRELLIGGDFEYYQDLKALAGDDWIASYEELKKELAEKNSMMYIQLIEHENDVDAILEYVREYPSTIEGYLLYLLESHAEEAVRLFEKHVKESAGNAFNRNQYKDVCQVLKRYAKTAGREAQMILIEELKQTYKNRPAFLDELGKL